MELFVTALATGTPVAILAALVGVVWQLYGAYNRDRSQENQAKLTMQLEQAKFEHQQRLEQERFAYDQQRWREDLGREMTVRLLEARIEEYSKLWQLVEEVSISKRIDPQKAKEVAKQIREWRYSKGDLLAERVTRDAAYTFQKALWAYDGTTELYKVIRQARRLLTQSLRSDLGLGNDVRGRNIFDIMNERQSISKALQEMEQKQ